jgi:hypothetical protein
MQQVGSTLQRAGVSRVYLVHGTFVGPDALGWLAELARLLPAASRAVRRVVARIIHRLTGDVGNYTEDYARCFEEAIAQPAGPPLPVQLFQWSSENHHIGRADAAVRLIDELASLGLQPGRRVLLWGHSHAGNVFALVSHLLSGNPEAAQRFFAAAEIYFRWPLLGWIDIPLWHRVRKLLCDPGQTQPLAGVALDMVTFGTPIRYGWDPHGYAKLLHFIYHRPAEGLPLYLAPFPPKFVNVLRAADGDYVQQFGIAGTNVPPSIFSWRARLADGRLCRLLQDQGLESGPAERFQAGAIVPDTGTTLLVDYGLPGGGIARHHAGHAVYTYKKWLLFHAEEVARRFYEEAQ